MLLRQRLKPLSYFSSSPRVYETFIAMLKKGKIFVNEQSNCFSLANIWAPKVLEQPMITWNDARARIRSTRYNTFQQSIIMLIMRFF